MKANEDFSGFCFQVGACRRFAKISKRLVNRIRDSQTMHIEIAEKVLQTNNNPELFNGFFCARYPTPSNRNVFTFLHRFGIRPQYS